MGTFSPIFQREKIKYAGQFFVQLYLAQTVPQILWNALLSVKGDIRNEKIYEQVSSKIYDNLRDYKYLK